MRARRLIGLLVVAAAGALAPAAAQAQWRAEPVPSMGGLGLLDLAFDARGQGLLVSEGYEQATGRRFTAVDLRDPATGWRPAPDLAGVTWGGAQVHLYGRMRALMVARRTASTDSFGRARMRLVYAPGRSDGTFAALRTISEDAADHVSAVNRDGEAIVAYRDRGGLAFVVERRARRGFGRPRPLTPGGSGAVAINDAGRRVVAWWGRDGVYARVRTPGGRWGPAVRVSRTRPYFETSVRAAVAPDGRIVLAWHTANVGEDIPFELASGVAIHARSAWRSFTLERTRPRGGPYLAGTPAIPVVDSANRIYVTWTGIAHGSPVVKLARITSSGARERTVLSGAVTGAAVDDAAAGPDRSLAVSWSAMMNYTDVISYASLRRGDGAFAAAERLTPDGIRGLTGSQIAFQPLTGEAVVAIRAVTPGGTAAMQAFASPAG